MPTYPSLPAYTHDFLHYPHPYQGDTLVEITKHIHCHSENRKNILKWLSTVSGALSTTILFNTHGTVREDIYHLYSTVQETDI